VLEPIPEDMPIKNSLIQLVTEDVPLQTPDLTNAESTEDQTTETSVLKLMSDAQVYHGNQFTLRLDLNSELPEKVGLKEDQEESGDHLLHTTSGTTTMVPKLFAETSVSELVPEPTPETETTELTSIQSVTEDAMLVLEAFHNAESTVDQTTMTRVLKLMSDVQANHTRDHHSTKSVQNSLSAETHTPAMSGEREVMEHGDHLLLTTSGITTTVPPSSVEIWAMEPVLELIPEDVKTKRTSIQLETEDVPLETPDLTNAESTVDQTTTTRALKLMSNVQEDHGDHITLELVKNSELPEKVGLKEDQEEFGDQYPHTGSGTTTMVLLLFAEI